MPGVGGKTVFSDFRVSLLEELWLAVTRSQRLSIKFKTNHRAPRAGQRAPFPRGKFKKLSNRIHFVVIIEFYICEMLLAKIGILSE